jgi:cytochrome c biogenesis protein CcdA
MALDPVVSLADAMPDVPIWTGYVMYALYAVGFICLVLLAVLMARSLRQHWRQAVRNKRNP